MDPEKRARLLELLKSKEESLVDSVIANGDDPNFAVEPEDKFQGTKDLSNINKLRKDGWTNDRIFQALEADMAEKQRLEAAKQGPPRPPKSTLEKVVLKTKRSVRGSELDAMSWMSYSGVPGYPSWEEMNEIYDEYEERIKNDPVYADNWLEYVLLSASGLSGSMYAGTKAGLPYAAAGMAGAAAVGAVTPVIPDEFVTVPLSGAGGLAVGTTAFWQQQGSGMMLRNLIKRGVDPNTAYGLASVGGLFYGLIERAQVSKFIPKSVQKKANNAVTKTLANWIGENSRKYGADYITQIGQEEAQLAIQLITEELAVALEGDIPHRQIEDMAAEAWETFKQTAAGLFPLQGTRVAVDMAVEMGPPKLQDMVSGLVDTQQEIETSSIVSPEEALTVETQAQQITEDEANDFNIVYDKESDGTREISGDELIATGYDPEKNNLPLTREDEYGNKFYAVKIKGENDSEGNIRLTSTADRSTILEETVEARLKQLKNSKESEDQALIAKIENWWEAVRKKASEMGLELRFVDTDEGNIELFSDAILYHKGGFTGLGKEFEAATYIPDQLADEFIGKFGEMSDGNNIFDILKSDQGGVAKADKDFRIGVDEELSSREEITKENQRPPPTAKNPAKTRQMTGLNPIKLTGTFQNWHPTPEDDINIKTPAFKKWFGNSEMKDSTDPEGGPAELYHGTNATFDSFMPMTYMTMDKRVAEFYARRHDAEDIEGYTPEHGFEWAREGSQIYPIYSNLKNTFEFDIDQYDLGERESFDEWIFIMNNLLERDGKEEFTKEEVDKIFDNFEGNFLSGDQNKNVGSSLDPGGFSLMESNDYEDQPFYRYIDLNLSLADALETRGYDGIVASEDIFSDGTDPTVFIAFNPESIKSKFNQGTFDPNDSRMSHQLEPGVVEQAVGIYPDVMNTKAKKDRLRLTVARREKTPLVGRQNNNRVEFELENGGVMILGRDKTPEDWIRQVESMLDPDEIKAAMNWYEDAYPAFVEEFGQDEAVTYMVAWLLGNVQASPQQALSNTFLGMEQLKAALPSFKSAGTKSVSKNIKTALQGLRTEKGAGAKLFDFLDSALGKLTRTVMQDDKRGLAPVAIDRHTYRDAGFVDAAIKNILGRLAIDKDRVKKLRFDSKSSSPTDTQYEYALKYMNDLTNSLNEMGYMGGNLKPHQVQAIGWTAIARMAESSEGQSIQDAIGLQKPTVAFALRFGDESPYSAIYGEAFDGMPENEKIALTDRVVQDVVPELAEELGLKVISIKGKGYGIWDNDPAEPNATINVRGSNQAIKALMNSIGILFQQSEVGLMSKAPNLKGLGMIYRHKELANPEMQQAVYDILREETDNDFTPGATSISYKGMPSLMVGTFVNQSDYEIHQPSLDAAVERIRNELGIDLDLPGAITPIGSKYEATKNNWKKDNRGERYRETIRKTHRPDLLGRLDNHYGPKVERHLESTFAKESDKRRKSYQLEPDPDYAAEVDAAIQAKEKTKSFNISTDTIIDSAKDFLFDSMGPLVRWQKDTEEQMLGGKRLRDHLNVVLASELFIGKTSEKISDLNKQIIDKDNPESFLRRLVDSGISTEDFNLYLHSLHAQERNDAVAEINEDLQDGGSGMTSKVAETLYKKYNKKYGRVKLRKFVQEFREEVIDKTLQIRLENGLITQEDYDNMTSKYDNYVPLFRVMDETDAILDDKKWWEKRLLGIPEKMKGLAGGSPQKFDVKGAESKKVRGSTRPVKNIIISAIEQHQGALLRSEKNVVNKRLLNLIEMFPDDSVFEVVGVQQKPVYDHNGEISFMQAKQQVIDSENNEVGDERMIHVKVDGKTKRIIFKGPQGLRIAGAMLNMGTNKAMKALQSINNYLRYVNTIADPGFIFSNFIRDIQMAGFAISAEQGDSIMAQALSPKALGRAWKGVYNIVQNEDIDSEWSQLYERLRKAGGKTGFFDYESIESKLEKLEVDLKRVESKGIGIKTAGKSIFNFIESLNEATESAVRLTLFKTLLDHGYSEEQAASGAKNVTINFNRKGQVGSFLNSGWLFANAGLQGNMRIYGVLKNSKKARRAVAGIAALGLTESISNNMASEDDDEYEKMSDWVKDNNMIFRYGSGDKYFKMRLAYGLNMFKVAGNIAGDITWAKMQGKPLEPWRHTARLLEGMNSAFNPLGSGPIDQIIAPTVMDPILQLSNNKAFHGGPIKPKSYYGPEKAEVEQAWSRTPDIYKNMSQWLFKAVGGKIRYNEDGGIDHAVRGPLDGFGDISPETLEYWVQYLGGGLGKTMMETVNTAQGVIEGDVDWSKAPFVNEFYGEFDDKSESRILYDYERNMNRDYYDMDVRLKYFNYLDSYYSKGNIDDKEYKARIRAFEKAQDKVFETKLGY